MTKIEKLDDENVIKVMNFLKKMLNQTPNTDFISLMS